MTPERLQEAIELVKSMSRGESFIISMGLGWSGPAQLSRRNADLMYDLRMFLEDCQNKSDAASAYISLSRSEPGSEAAEAAYHRYKEVAT